MKVYQRRAAGKPETYYKLATWDALSCCWRDGKKQFDSMNAAVAVIQTAKPGRYRVSQVNPDGKRYDYLPVVVPES
jgi:hypothetical protein